MSFLDVVKAGNAAFSLEGKEIVLPVIRNHFTRRGGSPDYRPGYRGSAVGKMCCREEVFKRILPRPQTEITPDVQSIFEVGHAVHERWQNHVLGPAGILEGWWHCKTCGHKIEGLMPGYVCPECESLRRCGSCAAKLEDNVYEEGHSCKKCKSASWEYEEYTLKAPEHGIVGHCDGVLLINGERYIWEFKTINDNGYTNRVSHKPLKEHVAQVQIYMWLKEVSFAIIHYVNKNDGAQREFMVEYDDSFRKELLRKISLIDRRLEDGSLPDHKVCGSRSTWRAKSCPWLRECFSAKIFNKSMAELKGGTND